MPSLPSNNFGRRALSDTPTDPPRPLARPRPSYSELCTQTDMSTVQPSSQNRSAPLRRFSSLSQRILRKCHQARFRSESVSSKADPSLPSATPDTTLPSRSPDLPQDAPDSPSSPLRHGTTPEESKLHGDKGSESTVPEANAVLENGQETDHETETHVAGAGFEAASDPAEKHALVGTFLQNADRAAHPPIQPPPPPWPEEPAPKQAEKAKDYQRSRAIGLHVQLPSTMQAQATTPGTPSSGTPGSVIGLAITQSPTAITPKPPLLSPALSNVVAHGSAKKRISFSDYLSRKGSAVTSHNAIPTSVALATSSPMMSAPGAAVKPQPKPANTAPLSNDGVASTSTSIPPLLDVKKEDGTSSVGALSAN